MSEENKFIPAEIATNMLYYHQKDGCEHGGQGCGKICYNCVESLLKERDKTWQTWGVIEIAVRNPNVSSYINEWEKRTIDAEAMVESVHRMLADRRREIDLLTIETDLMADWIRNRGGITSHYKEMAEAQYGTKPESTI